MLDDTMDHATTARRAPIPPDITGARGITMRPICPDVVARMMRLRGAFGGQSVMAQFGISDNTWRKIRLGEPIRASVADRLTARLAALP